MDIKALGTGVQSGNAVTTQTTPASQQANAASQTAATSGASTSSAAEPSASQVEKAVQKINASPAVQSQGIEFSIDSSSHRVVVKVVDQSNNEVIRQIPSKEALAIADSLDQSTGTGSSTSQGLLISQQA